MLCGMFIGPLKHVNVIKKLRPGHLINMSSIRIDKMSRAGEYHELKCSYGVHKVFYSKVTTFTGDYPCP